MPHYPSGSFPPYWMAVLCGAVAVFAFTAFFLLAGEKPLARRWKALVVGLLFSAVSLGSVIQGGSVPDPWTHGATGPGTTASITPLPPWLNVVVCVLSALLVLLLARDYRWLQWVRLWLDAFVFRRPETPKTPTTR